MTQEYHTIVTITSSDVEVYILLDQLQNDMEDTVLNHLQQWDHGPENEHSPSDTKTWATHDKTATFSAYDGWQYTIAWHHQMLRPALHDYVSLIRHR